MAQGGNRTAQRRKKSACRAAGEAPRRKRRGIFDRKGKSLWDSLAGARCQIQPATGRWTAAAQASFSRINASPSMMTGMPRTRQSTAVMTEHSMPILNPLSSQVWKSCR